MKGRSWETLANRSWETLANRSVRQSGAPATCSAFRRGWRSRDAGPSHVAQSGTRPAHARCDAQTSPAECRQRSVVGPMPGKETLRSLIRSSQACALCASPGSMALARSGAVHERSKRSPPPSLAPDARTTRQANTANPVRPALNHYHSSVDSSLDFISAYPSQQWSAGGMSEGSYPSPDHKQLPPHPDNHPQPAMSDPSPSQTPTVPTSSLVAASTVVQGDSRPACNGQFRGRLMLAVACGGAVRPRARGHKGLTLLRSPTARVQAAISSSRVRMIRSLSASGRRCGMWTGQSSARRAACHFRRT